MRKMKTKRYINVVHTTANISRLCLNDSNITNTKVSISHTCTHTLTLIQV